MKDEGYPIDKSRGLKNDAARLVISLRKLLWACIPCLQQRRSINSSYFILYTSSFFWSLVFSYYTKD